MSPSSFQWLLEIVISNSLFTKNIIIAQLKSMGVLLLAKAGPEDSKRSFGHVNSENTSQMTEPLT